MATEIAEGAQATADLMSSMSPDRTDVFAEGFVDHDPAPGQPEGGAGLGWYWQGVHEAFPDVELTNVETIVTPEHHVIVGDLTGTDTGSGFLGHEPTGKRFSVRNVQVMKIVDGRLVERWGSTDQLGILQQLGLAEDA